MRGVESPTLDHTIPHCSVWLLRVILLNPSRCSDVAVTKVIDDGALISDMHGRVSIPDFIAGCMSFYDLVWSFKIQRCERARV